MSYTIVTHDGWGSVAVGSFEELEEARRAFQALCEDPWYRRDGGVKALELVEGPAPGSGRRLAWHAFP